MQFRLWLETDRQTYYHVTYYKNLNSISFRGLIKNRRPNFTGHLAQNSQKGLFLANNNVRHWIGVLENWAEHNSDNIRKDGLIPIVLRVQAHPELTKPDDYAGNPDGAFFFSKNIRSDYIEMWNGESWTPTLDRRHVKLSKFIEKHDDGWYFVYRYPFPPEIG